MRQAEICRDNTYNLPAGYSMPETRERFIQFDSYSESLTLNVKCIVLRLNNTLSFDDRLIECSSRCWFLPLMLLFRLGGMPVQ
jgi:hypothetical protein